jgi:hypothetical protein
MIISALALLVTAFDRGLQGDAPEGDAESICAIEAIHRKSGGMVVLLL